MSHSEPITFLGKTDFRNQEARFGILPVDRLRHTYIIGKSGTGKSTLLENMFVQDVINGNGCAFFDPHGKAAEMMLENIPAHRVDDVIYFAPFDYDFPIAFNPLEHSENLEQNQRNFIADSLLAAFKKIWGAEKFSDRMEYILSMTLLALLETPGSTLLGINRMYSDKEFRNRVVENVTDVTVKSFWIQTFGTWDPKYAREASAAIENKIGQLSSNPLIRNIVGQQKSSFDFRWIMDNRKIFIANLSIGRIGEQNTSLLGAMLMSKLYLSAMSRADQNEANLSMLPPFYLFVDEFQNFANDSFENILSQARKYKLGLTVAHQYVEQMPEKLRYAIMGNVGTMVTFRIGPDDAELFEKQFSPVFVAQDFVNIAPYHIYLSLLINGLGSRPFSARTLPAIATPEISNAQAVIENTRIRYGRPRADVENWITNWYAPIPSKKDLEHQDYINKRKAEVEAAGGQWVPRDEHIQTIPQPSQQPQQQSSQNEYPRERAQQPERRQFNRDERPPRSTDTSFEQRPSRPIQSVQQTRIRGERPISPLPRTDTTKRIQTQQFTQTQQLTSPQATQAPVKQYVSSRQPVQVPQQKPPVQKISIADAFAEIPLAAPEIKDFLQIQKKPETTEPTLQEVAAPPVERVEPKKEVVQVITPVVPSDLQSDTITPAPIPEPLAEKPVIEPVAQVATPQLVEKPLDTQFKKQKEASIDSVSKLKDALEKARSSAGGLPTPPPPPARPAATSQPIQMPQQPQLTVEEVRQNEPIVVAPVQSVPPQQSATVGRAEITPETLAQILGTTDV